MADTEEHLSPWPGGNEEDGDVCRVCRVEGDEEDPLIYPCKCSGSVRFVHPGCLKNWLAHSQKRYCEICGHRYTFTKIYPEYIPVKIPRIVFLRQTVLWLYRWICHVHRFCLAVLGWLIILPSLNLITLRTLVWMADTSISYPTTVTSPLNHTSTSNVTNVTITATHANGSVTTETLPYPQNQDDIKSRDLFLRPLTFIVNIFTSSWRSWYRIDGDSIPGFVFRGQILSVTLAAVLVGLLFFREWIAQQNFTETIPAQTPEPEEINPDEWDVVDGVSRKRAGAINSHEEAAEALVELLRDQEARRARRTAQRQESDGPQGERAEVEGSASDPSGDRKRRRRQSQSRTAHPSDADESDEDRTSVPLGSPQSDGVPRPCGPDGASSSDVAYRAPEMLGGKGKGRAQETEDQLGLAIQQANSQDMETARGVAITLEDGEEIRFDGSSAAGPSIHDQLPNGSDPEPIPEVRPNDIASHSPDEVSSGDHSSSPLIEPPIIADMDVEDEAAGDDEWEDADDEAPVDVEEPIEAEIVIEEEVVVAADDAELDDEDRPFDREDWDGILEVVGLIGPFSNLLQNLAFAITAMGAALTLLVGLPIVAGKVALAMDILRMTITTTRLFSRVARAVTDPVFDIIVEISKEVIIVPLLSAFEALERIVGTRLRVPIHHPVSSHLTGVSARLSGMSSRLEDIRAVLAPSAGNVTLSSAFDTFGHQVDKAYHYQRDLSLHLATSDKLSDNVWCMFIGYAVVAFTIGGIALVGEWDIGATGLLDTIKRHAMFLKLAVFMGVELVVFPLTIGLVIGFSTIPLFEGATLGSSLGYLRDSPFGAIFVSWLVGTIFMFSFASFLSHIRSRTRPGALFFIRDPADQSFSPVKDILERTAGSQVRKLAVSAVMYTIVVVSIFGVASWGLSYQTLFPLLPLRTKNISPLTSVPFDLLYLHLVVPPTLNTFDPQLRASRLWDRYWRFTCTTLRLKSLMHGHQSNPAHQTGPKALEWMWPLLDPFFKFVFGKYDSTATYARVPASDQVALLPPSERRKGGVFIPLTEDGKPRDAEAKLRLLKQDQKARSMKRSPRKDYITVYLPSYWRTRIHVFIFTSIGVTAMFIAMAAFVPIIVGRAAFGMCTASPIHDGYSFMAGCYICLVAGYTGAWVKRRIKRYGVAGRLRRSLVSTRVKRVLLPALTNIYAIFLLYFVLPSLSGLLFELNVGMLWKYGLGTDRRPVLHFWDTWAIGNALDSLLVGMRTAFPPRPRRGHRRQLYNVALLLHAPFGKHIAHVNATTFPLIGRLLTLILIPLLLAPVLHFVGRLAALPESLNVLYFRLLYPITSVTLFSFKTRDLVQQKLRQMRQKMIDAEYEIEERVENYDASRDHANKDVQVEVLRSNGNRAELNGDVNGDEADWQDVDED